MAEIAAESAFGVAMGIHTGYFAPAPEVRRSSPETGPRRTFRPRDGISTAAEGDFFRPGAAFGLGFTGIWKGKRRAGHATRRGQ